MSGLTELIDRLTAIKIKTGEQSYSDPIPVGCKAEDVIWTKVDDTYYSLEDILGGFDPTEENFKTVKQQLAGKVSYSDVESFIDNNIVGAVEAWLEDHDIDYDLQVQGKAADAKKTGDGIRDNTREINNINNNKLPWNPTTPGLNRPMTLRGDVPDAIIENDPDNVATGQGSHAEGNNTEATSAYAHAEGSFTKARSNFSHTEGYNTTASGQASHAEGGYTTTTVDAEYGHAQGFQTTASGNSAHAEGSETNASGINSHAEGYGTTASGYNAHAEGFQTNASGGAHAEGYQTAASGGNSHAQGYQTIASGSFSHTEGVGTTANHKAQHVFGENNISDPSIAGRTSRGNYVQIVGNGTSLNERSNARTLDWDGNEVLAGKLTVGSGPTDNMDVTTKQYVINTINSSISSAQGDILAIKTATASDVDKALSPKTVVNGEVTEWQFKNIVQAGGVTDYLDLANRPAIIQGTGTEATRENSAGTASGDYSHAEGYYTEAVGDYSHAEGSQTQANGNYSHAEGQNTVANGTHSHAEGLQAEAIGNWAHAQGMRTTASGENSHAEGARTIASKPSSHAQGLWTTASNFASHAEGERTVASGYQSHAEGNNTTASGDYSHAEGASFTPEGRSQIRTTASGDYSHAEGAGTTASGSQSHAEGQVTIASGQFGSHAEGHNTTASGNCSHAEGEGTTASGDCSHAEGRQTYATGDCSHAEGDLNTASGYSSHAEGITTTASGYGSHAQNQGTRAASQNQTAMGKYNIEDSNDNYALIIGNGTGPSSRSNAMTVDWQGNQTLAGTLTVGVNSNTPDTTLEILSDRISGLDQNGITYGSIIFSYYDGIQIRNVLTGQKIQMDSNGVSIYNSGGNSINLNNAMILVENESITDTINMSGTNTTSGGKTIPIGRLLSEGQYMIAGGFYVNDSTILGLTSGVNLNIIGGETIATGANEVVNAVTRHVSCTGFTTIPSGGKEISLYCGLTGDPSADSRVRNPINITVWMKAFKIGF